MKENFLYIYNIYHNFQIFFFLHFDGIFEHILIKRKSMRYWIRLFKALKFSRFARILLLM